MTANTANLIIATLVRQDGTKVEITGAMKNADMIAALKTAGHPIGATSLRELIAGKKTEVNGWTLVKAEADKKDEKAAPAAFNFPKGSDQPTKDEEKPAAPLNLAQMQQDALNAAPKQLTPEQLALAAKVENELPGSQLKPGQSIDPATGKITHRGANWSEILPQAPIPVKDGSMIHRLLVRLCDPKGATKQELLSEFGWSAGGLSGILHWEPKAKGYFLHSEKKDGELRYYLQEIGTGRRYGAEEILVKAAAAPKAPKEPKAPKVQAAAAADASKPVKVTKEQKAQVPNLGAANVTKRVAVKKPA
jgi:hypothetical protein